MSNTTFFKYNEIYIDTEDMDDKDKVEEYFNEMFNELSESIDPDDEIMLDEEWNNWLDVCITNGNLSQEMADNIERV